MKKDPILRKSEILKLDHDQEENDIVAVGKYKKYVREVRSERFDDKYLIILKNNYKIEHLEKMGCYRIDTIPKTYGIVDFYPKSNKLFFHSEKTKPRHAWKGQGLKWILDYLIYE